VQRLEIFHIHTFVEAMSRVTLWYCQLCCKTDYFA
jgi:hypothetical protein